MKGKHLLSSQSGPVLLMVIALGFLMLNMPHDIGTRQQPGPGAFPLLIALALIVFLLLGVRKGSDGALGDIMRSSCRSPNSQVPLLPPPLPLIPVCTLLLFCALITFSSPAVAIVLTALAAVTPFRDVRPVTRIVTATGIATLILLGYHGNDVISLLVSQLT